MIDVLKNIMRPVKNVVFTIVFFIYDMFRFTVYSGMLKRDRVQRDFRLIKIYHTLEKSLAFSKQRKGAGQSVKKLLKGYLGSNTPRETYSEKVAEDVLTVFENNANDVPTEKNMLGGSMPYSKYRLEKGTLEEPEQFFFSRYSVREFDSIQVEKDQIIKAIDLASKTPSSCNRQPWFTYHIDDLELIREVLSIQGGANGFSETISNLVVIAVDQRAYDTAVERYQGWIDGGMYGMSFVYACHSLGLGTCCLNWAKNISDERRLRRLLPLEKEHSVLMFVAVGLASAEFKVCRSERTPVMHKYKYFNKPQKAGVV